MNFFGWKVQIFGDLYFTSIIIESAFLLLLLVTGWKACWTIIRNYRLGQVLSKLCGTDRSHWFYGHTRKYGFDERGLLNIARRTAKFPYTFCSWVGPFLPQVAVVHPDTISPALSALVPKNNLTYRMVRPWIGDGLLTSSGAKWHRNRRLLTPAFHYKILKQYVKVFNNCARALLNGWENDIGKPIDVTSGISLMTLDTMLQCAMTYKTGCQSITQKSPYIQAVDILTSLIITRMENPILLIDWIFYRTNKGMKFKQALQVVHGETEQIIKKRRKALQQSNDDLNSNKKEILDFLDILLQTKDENGKGLTDAEIRDEVDTFLFEGHDTTASGISWILFNLAKYPDLQQRCRGEVINIAPGDRDIEWEDLSKLSYLTMFIKESLRLYPPVPGVGRFLDKPLNFRKPTNITIPSNCNMAISILSCHRNPHVWEDPERFDPERFTLENISKRSSHAYIPFSAGPRNCIGQNFAMNEMKVVVSQALKTFRFYLDDETPHPVMRHNLVLRGRDGIHVKMDDVRKKTLYI